MASNSKIEWTESTWNPLVGCTKVSQGCKHCYAMTMAARIANAAQRFLRDGKVLTDVQNAYLRVVRWERGGMDAADFYDKALPQWNNRVELIESVLMAPLRAKNPKVYFVNSMSDLFHEAVSFEFVDKVFAAMALCPQHTSQVLTKRPERAAEYFAIEDTAARIGLATEEFRGPGYCDWEWPLPNVWIGTSVEDQKTADERIPHLLQVPAAVRFLSCGPLLGPVDLLDLPASYPEEEGGESLNRPLLRLNALKGGYWCGPGRFGPETRSVNWVICGGESGHGARPMHPDWARSLRDQCAAAGVPFFFKQVGEWAWSENNDELLTLGSGRLRKGEAEEWPKWTRVGKKRAGRLLDGREWNQFPEVASRG